MFFLRGNLQRLARRSLQRHVQAAGVSSAVFSRRFALEVRAAERMVHRLMDPEQIGLQQRSLSRPYSSQPPRAGGSPASGPGGDSREGAGSGNGNDDEKEKGKQILRFLIVANLTIYAIFSLIRGTGSSSDPRRSQGQGETPLISWNDFYHNMLARGEVEMVTVFPEHEMAVVKLQPGAIIKGQPTGRRSFLMNVVDVDQFEAKLREAERQLGVKPGSVPVSYRRNSGELTSALLTLLMLGGLLALMSKFQKMKPMDMFGSLRKAKFQMYDQSPTSKQPKVMFSDVAGCHNAKQELGEFIDYLRDSTKYRRLGAKTPKGVLLLGPPGCGKTMLAKAVASEAKVPFLAMAGSEFIEMIGGLGAARVRSLFQEARKLSPCIIYIDEVDAIGRNRAMDQSSGEGEQTLNQLLVEMDGMATKEGVLMLASTNREDILDKALLRPGRFDRHIMIDLPNQAERIEIFDKYLSELVLDKHPTAYSKRLAQLTPGFSGADIANVCNEAALHAARTLKRNVTSADIDYAVDRVFGGAEKKTHAVSPEERKRLAVYWSGFAVVTWFLERTEKLLKLSIVTRTKSVGSVQFDLQERYNYTADELFGKICVKLAGRAAEVAVYGQPSSGTATELKAVTDMARAMVQSYGMDDTIGPLSYSERKAYSKKLVNTIDYQASQLVHQAYQKALAVIRENSEKLQLLADELEKKETLNYADIEAVLGPRPHDQEQ